MGEGERERVGVAAPRAWEEKDPGGEVAEEEEQVQEGAGGSVHGNVYTDIPYMPNMPNMPNMPYTAGGSVHGHVTASVHGNVLTGTHHGAAIVLIGRASSRVLSCSFVEAGVGVAIGDRARARVVSFRPPPFFCLVVCFSSFFLSFVFWWILLLTRHTCRG